MIDIERQNQDAAAIEVLGARFAAAYGEPVVSGSKFHRWLLDPDFWKTFDLVRGHTLVDHARCFDLWSLVEETAKIDGDILEVGVWRGGTGCIMATRAQMIGRKGDVFLCDTFRGVVKAGAIDGYSGGEHADTDIGVVNQLLADAKVRNCIVLTGIFPDETGSTIAARRFSLCHIDVDVYQSALDVFDWVWPRMSTGGVVVFDDYGNEGCAGITTLVESLRTRSDLVFIYNVNGHAIFVKTKNQLAAVHRLSVTGWLNLFIDLDAVGVRHMRIYPDADIGSGSSQFHESTFV